MCFQFEYKSVPNQYLMTNLINNLQHITNENLGDHRTKQSETHLKRLFTYFGVNVHIIRILFIDFIHYVRKRNTEKV